MRRKRVTRIRIPLESLTDEEQEKIKEQHLSGKYKIVIVDEPCLTCGHKKRIQHLHRTDGKRELVQECIYCMCRIHTVQNKEDV
jgi:hypothetical protein